MLRFALPVMMIFSTAGCGDAPNTSLEKEVKELNTRLLAAEAETKTLRSELAQERLKNDPKSEETSSGNSSSKMQNTVRRDSIVLLVDSNRVGTFRSLVECQNAASKVNREAEQEQKRIDELNRLEFEKEGPPGIIRGRVKQQKTQCLEIN
ncbi:MAG: hypothetical protein KA292_12850 [Sphingorhabdus sp.]|nr:hypothetical protein [Sphingorhabdus sp.]